AIHAAGAGSQTIGIDDAACPPALREALSAAVPSARFVDASEWALGVRAVKLTGEIELIEESARITERAILDGIAHARIGMSEAEIARTVAASMVAAGAAPRFVVVTSGERSALADAHATQRQLRPGDLLRFDVGGVYEGYWSDL